MIKNTPCECTAGGVCKHHLRFIGPRGVMLCQNSKKHYDAFHEGVEARQLKILEMPTLIDQAKSFASALTTLASDGFVQTSKEIREFRESLCAQCPGNESGRCRGCGCWISVKVKFPAESCPIGIWPADHPQQENGTPQPCGCNGASAG